MTATDTQVDGAPIPAATRAEASQAYAVHRRAVVEDELILDNLAMVRHIVQKVVFHLSRKDDVEDLISAGTLGLVKAARAFDPARNVKFSTYAYTRIRGAVIDEMRRRTFVPANVYNRIRQARKAYTAYINRHGHPPTDEQLAAELGVSPSQLYRLLEEARRQNFLSIHGLSEGPAIFGELVPPSRDPTPDQQAEQAEMINRLSEGLTELPQRDRMLLLLYYDKDLTMREIAEVLEITESRVSQLHAGALFKLAMRLRTGR